MRTTTLRSVCSPLPVSSNSFFFFYSSSAPFSSNALRKQTIQKNLLQFNNNGDQDNKNNSLCISTAHPPCTDAPVSPLSKSPLSSHTAPESHAHTGLRSSLVREKGHIYSLAAAGSLLYTGSESKNIRVWKNQKEFSSFKSSSGLVKAIIIDADRIEMR